MPATTELSSHLMGLVSTAVAPVVLISATAILLSGYTNKQSNIAAQMRSLAEEYRRASTTAERRTSICRQLVLFQRREMAIWTTNLALSFSLLCYLITIFSAMLEQRLDRIGIVGATSLVMGLTLMLIGVLIELYEIYLSRITMSIEIADICALPPASAARGALDDKAGTP